jgi:hypothetical protein
MGTARAQLRDSVGALSAISPGMLALFLQFIYRDA